MRQSWRDLLFLHFPCDPAEVAPLLPKGLTVDTFPDAEGVEQAWIGLVPFLMRDVRWAFAPPFPRTHTFPETNVRTYVRGESGAGVWFFSLDAMNNLAVRTARIAFALPYFFSRMTLSREGDQLRYEGNRSDASYRIEARIGERMASPQPGSLEYFLVERYLLYAARRNRLWSGQVRHAPYPLHAASVESLKETLVHAVGLKPREFVHAVYSEGVDVDVFPLNRLR